MSYCKKTGPDNKDIVIFATKENHSVPSKVELPPAEPAPGLILENGDINWNCPCLGGMATGPCGVEFRTAFSCFHYSDHEPKGAECLESFQAMQDCMKRYPSLYSNIDKESDHNEFDESAQLIMPVQTPQESTEKDSVTTISKTTELKN